MDSNNCFEKKYSLFMSTLKHNVITPRYYLEIEYMKKFTTLHKLVDVKGNGSCWIYSLLLLHDNISRMFYKYYLKHIPKLNSEEDSALLHNISYYFRQFVVLNMSLLKDKELSNIYKKSPLKNQIKNYLDWKKICYTNIISEILPWKKANDRKKYDSDDISDINRCSVPDVEAVLQYISYICNVSFQLNLQGLNTLITTKKYIFKKSGAVDILNFDSKKEKLTESNTYPTMLMYPEYDPYKRTISGLMHINYYTHDNTDYDSDATVKHIIEPVDDEFPSYGSYSIASKKKVSAPTSSCIGITVDGMRECSTSDEIYNQYQNNKSRPKSVNQLKHVISNFSL